MSNERSTTASTLSAVDFDPFGGPAIEATVPSTEPQREIWTAARLGPEASLAFNESVSLRLRGRLDLQLLRAALTDLVERHESLRATFSPDGLTFCVAAQMPVLAPLVDLSELGPQEREAEWALAREREVCAPFELEQGPLVRVVVLRFGPEDHVVVVTAHHIILDGWSWPVLLGDWARLYSARLRGAPAELPPADRFTEYAQEQADRQRSPELREAEGYWLKQFAGDIPVLDLPADRPRPALKSFSSRREDVPLDSELVQQIKRTGAQEGASFFTTLLAAFKVLVHRLSGQEDVIVGIPAAGQAVAGRNGLVGHCVNTLPLRSQVRPDDSFRDLLKRVRGTMLDAYEHQEHTFGSLLRKLPLPRDPSRQPLVSVVFNIDQAVSKEALPFERLDAELITNPRHFETFDLFVNAVDGPRGVVLECQYNTDLFDRDTVLRFMASYEVLLRGLVKDAGGLVGNLPLLSEADRQRILFDWNRPSPPHRPEATVHQLFSEQAAARPDAMALVHGDRTMTYGELDRRSNQLARHLQGLGVARGVPVGLCLERSFDVIVALLGILKAGGAYLPLEHSYPQDRLAFMLEDAGVSLLVTQSSLESVFSDLPGRKFLLDREQDTLARESAQALAEDPAASDSMCYVTYTSGSTGRPKGVPLLHRGVNKLVCAVDYARLGPETTLMHSANLAFDASTFEIWAALLNGGRLALYPENVPTGAGLAAAIQKHGVNTLFLTTALFNAVVDEDPNLLQGVQQLYVGGEALSVPHVRRLLEARPEIELHNMYGPSEVTTAATTWRLRLPIPPGARTVPIGRPMRETRLYVLDNRMQPVPEGVTGELFVGGAGLAAGYLNRPELTAERFLSDPFVPGERVYRTGDLVRYLPGGALDFVGRGDGQVKIRGFRIELGEIEAALLAQQAIGQATVVAREDRPGAKVLVAYVVLKPGPAATDEELLQPLRRALPKFMVPQHVVRLDRLPLNSSGKVDKKALPAPASTGGDADAYAPPETPTERMLAGLWEKALGLRRIGIHDDFFSLGGHSLLAAQVLSRLNREHQIVLPFRTVFEAPTVAQFASVIDARNPEGQAPVVSRIGRRPADGPAPVSLMQERILLLEELDPDRRMVHNVCSAFRLQGALDVTALERALGDVVKRQEALRTTFRKEGGTYRQIVGPAYDLRLEPALDLRGQGEAEQMAAVREFLKKERERSLDLEKGPLFKAFLIRLRDEEHVFFTLRHNAVWDGWSFDIFRHELSALYEEHLGGPPASLPDLPVSYSDFAAWHRNFLAGPEIRSGLEFWRGQLASGPPPLDLPTDRPRPKTRGFAGGDELFFIPRQEADAVAALGQELGATSFMVLLAALEVLLWRYTGQTDLVVASPVRNRPRPEIEDVIGLFTNTLMLRNRLHPAESFRELVKRVRAVTLDAFTHQEVPFDLLAQEAPPLRILFSLQEGRHRETNLGPVKLTLPPGVLPPAAALDVTLWVVEMEEGLKGALSYSSELFDRETMQRLLRHYRQIVASALSDSRRPLAELSLASPEELRRVEALGRGPAEPMGSLKLRDLVVLNRRRAPEEEALTSRRGSWSGRALATRVEGLARWLQAEGAGSGVRVGLALEDETDRLLALLAVFRAGAVAVPLDRNPTSRLEAGVSAAGVTHVVTEPDLADEVGSASLRALTLPSEAAISLQSWSLVDGTSEAALLSLVPRPAGGLEAWATPQRHVESALAEVARMLNLGSEDVVAVTPEAGPLAALLPFFAGARLVLVDAETVEDADDLARAIDEAGATVLVAVPETLRALLAVPPVAPKLRLLSSEILPEGLGAELAAKWGSVFSVYGVEEAGVWNALARVGAEAAYARVGHALAGNDLLVLDDRGMPSPVDVPGELVLAGSGLALVEGAGRDKDYEPDPGRPGHLRLRTGERARYRSDGSLELLGRGDGRFRLRGRRLERAEIGACLLELPDLRDAQVLVRHDRRGQPRLVAYVVRQAGTTGTDTELRRHLRHRLPEAMVPAHFVALDALPRRTDGRLDETLLPTPAALRAGEGREEPPRTSEERLLAELWSQSLGVRDVSRRDNFFDLGGHSLLCLQMVGQIEARTGKRIKPRLLLLSSLEQVAAELAGIEPGRA